MRDGTEVVPRGGIIFRPFALEDLAAVAPDEAVAELDPRAAELMTGQGLAWTGLRPAGFGRQAGLDADDDDARVIVGCGGILPQHAHRGLTWLAVRPGVPRRAWLEIAAMAEQMLARAHRLGLRRIEADVRTTFAPGIGFALRLGFQVEANRPLYEADGGASLLLARFG